MNDDPKQTADSDGSGRYERIQEIANDCLRRWIADESVSIELLCDLHEDLLPELEHELRKAHVIAKAVPPAKSSSLSSTMSVEGDQTRTFRDDVVPTKIGRYDVQRVLGEGGLGRVYLGYDSTLRREVAIKVPRPDRVPRREDVQSFLTEAEILASLKHPHIVAVYDAGQMEDGRCYLVSEYIRGTDLAERIDRQPLSFAESAELVATIAEALHYAHNRKLVHRDVKPANILLDAVGTPHLADFGLALREEDIGKESGLAGTASYMSPEQARGEGHLVDGRSDVYSLGVVLYELLVGERPHTGDNYWQVIERIKTQEARPPRQIRYTIPKELETICLKSLSKSLSSRYTTAKDFAEDLYDWLASPARPEVRQVCTVDQADDAESRYLANLVESLQTRKGVVDYVPLPVIATVAEGFSDAATQSRRSIADEWGVDDALAMLEQHHHNDRVSRYTTSQTLCTIPLKDVFEAARKYPRFVLLGAPGAGKTASLQRLALEAGRQRQSRPQEAPLPLLVYLARWNNARNPADLIRDHWQSANLPATDAVKMRSAEQMFVFFDGLNEMGHWSPSRSQQLREWLHGSSAPRRVIVTCRADAYTPELQLDLPVVSIREMDNSHVEEYVRSYLEEKLVPCFLKLLMQPHHRAGHSEGLIELARNPFMLSGLLLVYASANQPTLPRNTGELLRRLVASLWERERLRAADRWVPRNIMESQLSSLAFSMIECDLPSEISIAYAMQHLRNDKLFEAVCGASLLDRHDETVRFHHHLLQEYFAALALLRDRLTEYLKPLEVALGNRVGTKWDQAILARTGVEPEADEMVAEIVEIDPLLAAKCEFSGARISAATRQSIVHSLVDVLKRSEPSDRMIAARTIAEYGYYEAAGDLLACLADENTLVRAVVAWALGQLAEPATIPQLAAASLSEQETRSVRRQLTRSLGRMGQEAMPHLLRLLMDRDKAMREVAADELLAIGKPAAERLVRLLRSKNADASGMAAELLGQIADPRSVAALADRLADKRKMRSGERVCDLAAEALAEIGTVEAMKVLSRRRR